MGFLSKTWKKIKGWIIPSTPKPTGFNVEKKGTNQGVPIIYGFAKKAPSVKVFKATTDTSGGAWNEYLHFICVFAVGEIEEIGSLYFNDIPEAQIDNERYFIKRFVGSESQSACAELSAEFSLWRSTAKLKNVAYAYVRLKQNKKVDWWQGEPSIAADIKGLKVLDVRDNVVKYSENPALCTYDYLTNADYGKGLETNKINIASITTAATFIETSRTITRTVYRTWFDQESRTWMRRPDGVENETVIDNLMSCNVILDPEETIKKNVEILLGGMRAILPETNGQYRLSIEKDDAPVGAFTRDNLVGAIQCQGGSQSDRYNQVIIKFRNKLTGEADEAVYPSDDALHQEWKQADKGKLLLGEFDFDTINNKAEALQMGHVIAYRSRALIGALFNALPETIIYEAGDVVTVDSQIFGWNTKPFRIEAVEIDLETGLVNFQAVEHQNSIYPWAVNDVTEEYADTSFLFPSNLAKPTGLVFTPITDDNLKQGQLIWNDANNALVKFYRVVILDSNAAIVKSGETIETFFDVFGLGSGSYTLKVYSGNSLFLSQNANISVTLIKTTVGWDSVEGFDYEDERISNASITGFVTSDLYANEKAVLQSQIDKSITTWFYDGEPTLSSEPALNWQTTGDKNTHLGDLYYDNLTGYAHRFMINQTVYEWGKVTDSDVVKALSDAAKAQDTADSKRRVFVADPVTPYDVGDLWDIGGAIKRCKTALVTGPYNADHWVLVSDTTNYADVRVSNETALAAAATAAQAKANAAEVTAKAYADGIVTTAEASAIAAAQEKANAAEVKAKAYADGIVTTAEASAIAAAQTKATLAEVTAKAYADGIVTTAEASAIAAAQAKADAAEANAKLYVDNVTLGGRNLFENSAEIEMNNTTSEHGYFANIAHVMNKVEVGDEITISFDIKQLDNGNNGQFIKCYSSNQRTDKNFTGFEFHNIGTNWTRLNHTTRVTMAGTNNTETGTRIEFYSNYDTGDFWHVKNLKIERGNKVSDWTLAPEDLQAKADEAQAAAIAAATTAAQTKATLAEVTAKAYADGIVTSAEARAIADATAKADAAKAAAIASAATTAQAKADAAKAAAILAADTAAQAKANAAEVTAKAYADGIVTTAEASAIAAAQDKANAAEAKAKAYADGIVTTAEASAIAAAQTKATLAEVTAKAYADGIVTTAEASAIAAAQTKADAAEANAKLYVDNVTLGGRNLFENSAEIEMNNTTSEHGFLANIGHVMDKVESGDEITISFDVKQLNKDNDAQFIQCYSSNVRTDKNFNAGVFHNIGTNWTRLNFTTKVTPAGSNTSEGGTRIEFYSGYDTGDFWHVKNLKIERGNKVSDWTLAPEDLQIKADAAEAAAIVAATTAAQTKATLAEVTAKAYADGIVTSAEARSIADATAKADAAKAAAIASAATTAQAKADAAKAAAILAADTAAQAKANAAEVTAKAYADGIVTTAEASAIAAAQTKANAAQQAAISKANEFTAIKSSDHTLFDLSGLAPHIMPAGAPVPKGYSLTSARNIISDYIPVRKGETLHYEVWARQTGSTSRCYAGLSRYDRSKKAIAGNNANVYGGLINTVLSKGWVKYTFSHTLPTSHSPYSGSDGNEVCFVKIVLLMNYNTTGQMYLSGFRLFRVPDQQYMPNLVSAGAGTALNVNPLSASDNGTSAKINIASHTRQYGFGVLSLNAGSITGLSFNTKYYVYYDDETYKGGAVAYKSTTALQAIAAGNHRVFVSSITTPSNGGGTTQPPYEQCITFDMWLNESLQAEFVKEDDTLDLWWRGKQSVKGRVIQARQIAQKQVVYEIQTCSGAVVRISENTPLELKDHVIITPKELRLGRDELATLKGDNKTLYWETVTRCEIIGEQKVVRISVGNGSFAAGLDPNNRIITHNAQYKP